MGHKYENNFDNNIVKFCEIYLFFYHKYFVCVNNVFSALEPKERYNSKLVFSGEKYTGGERS